MSVFESKYPELEAANASDSTDERAQAALDEESARRQGVARAVAALSERKIRLADDPFNCALLANPKTTAAHVLTTAHHQHNNHTTYGA